jgi:hypothetical protein
MIKIFSAAGLAATTLFATSAMAQPAGTAKLMTMVEVLQQLEKQGYSAFQEIDRDGGVYEVTATSPDGQFVEFNVDGATGQISQVERDD